MRNVLAAALFLIAAPALAQSPGTVNLPGRTTPTGAPTITTAAQLNSAVNGALTAKADTVNGVLATPAITGGTLTGATFTGGAISGATGAFTTLSASGAATVSGLLTGGNSLFGGLMHMAQPAAIQFDGSRTWSGGQTSTTGGAEFVSFTNQGGTTTAGGPVAFHYLGVASDTVQASANSVNVLRVDHTTGNNILGGRVTIQANLNVAGTLQDSFGQYVVAAFAGHASGPAGSSESIVYGTNPTAGLSTGATGVWSAVGEEIDVRAVAGTTPKMLTGMTVVLVGGHAVAGTLGLDSAISIGNQLSVTGGWDYGIRFNGPIVPAPFKTTSTIIWAYPAVSATTVLNGIDFTNFTFTGSFLKSVGFSVNGAGVTTASAYKVGATAGVSCAANTVVLTTLEVTNGIVTHC